MHCTKITVREKQEKTRASCSTPYRYTNLHRHRHMRLNAQSTLYRTLREGKRRRRRSGNESSRAGPTRLAAHHHLSITTFPLVHHLFFRSSLPCTPVAATAPTTNPGLVAWLGQLPRPIAVCLDSGLFPPPANFGGGVVLGWIARL